MRPLTEKEKERNREWHRLARQSLPFWQRWNFAGWLLLLVAALQLLFVWWYRSR